MYVENLSDENEFKQGWQQTKRGRGQWAVYYTSPQSFKLMFSYMFGQQLKGLLWILICCFIKLGAQTFQPLHLF